MNRIDTKIRATGFNKGQEVDLWYQLHAALDVLCAQLDAIPVSLIPIIKPTASQR
jgi:hypothetical protein